MTLKKSHIIKSIHNNCGYSKTKSIELAEIFFDIVKRTLESGEDILISGFGKFTVVDKGEQRGRNPATGNELTLGAISFLQKKVFIKLCF
jgi:integration host factor subunit alpha